MGMEPANAPSAPSKSWGSGLILAAVIPAFLIFTMIVMRQGAPSTTTAVLLNSQRSEVKSHLSSLSSALQELQLHSKEDEELVAKRWGVIEKSMAGIQGNLQSLQDSFKAATPQHQEQSWSSRSLVFDNAWGKEALDKLQAWRSTLFLRIAMMYTKVEEKATAGGTTFKDNFRAEPSKWDRYNIANPIISCPYGQLERVGGKIDGKLVCKEGLLNQPGCIVYSLGSAGIYQFEEAMLKSTPCDVYTLDCTWDGKSLDGNKRHFYHKICLARQTRTVESDGKKMEYMDYPTILATLGHMKSRISLLKIDIEGYEFDSLSGWNEKEGCELPLQVSMEVHYKLLYNMGGMYKGAARVADTDFSNLYWPRHELSLAEIGTWFGHFANLGYAVVSREDNVGNWCCTEFTFLKLEQPANCPRLS